MSPKTYFKKNVPTSAATPETHTHRHTQSPDFLSECIVRTVNVADMINEVF